MTQSKRIVFTLTIITHENIILQYIKEDFVNNSVVRMYSQRTRELLFSCYCFNLIHCTEILKSRQIINVEVDVPL